MQQRHGHMLRLSAVFLLVPTLLATVASVPTSVLVQNSELSATNNDIASLNSLKLRGNAAKVKRSPTSSKDASQDISATTVTATPSNNALEKKSSPEVVPSLFNLPQPQSQSQNHGLDSMAYSLPENSDLINSAIAAGLTAAAVEAAAAATRQRELDEAQAYENESPALLQKRGINSAQQQAYPYGVNDGYYSNPFLSQPLSSSQLPNGGTWADELDPAVGYSDLQDLEGYPPIQRANTYRNKAYDNLQNLLNAETYLEPVALPYSNRFYDSLSDRRKRSNSNKFNKFADRRSPKRETQLTPADMLALVALVEAGARKNSEPESLQSLYPANNFPSRNYLGNNVGLYDYPAFSMDDDAIRGDKFRPNDDDTLYDPPADTDYYEAPLNDNVGTIPKYDFSAPRDQKYSGRNRFAIKRFMVAKKNRLVGKFLNAPVAQPSITYNSNDGNYF